MRSPKGRRTKYSPTHGTLRLSAEEGAGRCSDIAVISANLASLKVNSHHSRITSGITEFGYFMHLKAMCVS
jgi:hypothetical protein